MKPGFVASAVGLAAVAGLAVLAGAAFLTFNNSAGAGQSSETHIVRQDASVTFDDVELAIAQTLDCIEEAGMAVDTVPATGLRHTEYRIFASDPDGQPDAATVGAAQRAAAECNATFFTPVSDARQAELGEPTEDKLTAFYDWLGDCLASGGGPAVAGETWGSYTVYRNAPDRTIEVAEDQLGIYGRCAQKGEEAFGLLAPPPTR